MKYPIATFFASRTLVALCVVCWAGHAAATDMYVQPTGVGIGTSAPERMLHLKGPNAVFRMDRPMDAAAFLIVRTTPAGVPLKSFVVGTMASGSNNGQFVINDLGATVSGAGDRRMTVENNGNVTFTGAVTAASYLQPSSSELKQDIATIEAPITALNSIRGVRFNWKASGKASLGLIAEEVQKIYPELVALDQTTGKITGVDYSGLIGVLIEAVKEQQRTIDSQGAAIETLQQQVNRLIENN